MKKLIILGAGGFSKSLIDSLDHLKYQLVGFIDSFKKGEHQGYPIISDNIKNLHNREEYVYFIGIGDPHSRSNFFQQLNNLNLEQINIIDPTSLLSRNITLGQGIYIGKMCIVNADSVLADGVVINTRSLVEHGNRIGFCANISTNVVLNGDVQIGEKTFVGSSTVVNGQINIGSNTTIGSGSVVIRDIPSDVIVAGSPTHLIRNLK